MSSHRLIDLIALSIRNRNENDANLHVLLALGARLHIYNPVVKVSLYVGDWAAVLTIPGCQHDGGRPEAVKAPC